MKSHVVIINKQINFLNILISSISFAFSCPSARLHNIYPTPLKKELPLTSLQSSIIHRNSCPHLPLLLMLKDLLPYSRQDLSGSDINNNLCA